MLGQFVHPSPQMTEYDLPEQKDAAVWPDACSIPNISPAAIDTMADVMERRCLEMQLQHFHKMEAIGTIASGVAHNFRNTLNEILINSQVLQMNYKDDSELQKITEHIHTSVKRAARLVDDLLQFSRKQAKEEFKPLDLTELIKETYEIIRTTVDSKIDIRIELPHSLPVMGDPSRLSQVLLNLYNNARDAMPEGGVLRIEAQPAGNMAVVVVSDTGEGMDSETIEKCFDPFFTTKPIGKGIGMGLPAAYGIIKSHDGLIRVDSEPGKGTIVKILLPLATDDARIETSPKPKLIHGRVKRLEVVDDKPAIFNVCQTCRAQLDNSRPMQPAVKTL